MAYRLTSRLSIAALLVLAGCTAADTPSRAQTAPPQALSPVSEWTAGIVERPPIEASPLLTGITADRHERFDRLTFSFSGPLPGFHLEYIDRPVRHCLSGTPIPLPGDGWLEIRFRPAIAAEVKPPSTVDLGVVREIVQTCDSEQTVSWVLAVSSPNRFRVLQSPSQVVVDVAHR